MAKNKKWTKEKLLKVFELLIESDHPIVSHKEFRKRLDRDRNLLANQIIRQANGNIAYRSVDCDPLNLSDEEFWEYIDNTQYSDMIEENAAVAILKMAEKLELNS
ncbi:MAG: hypothetical protein ABH859_05715 [Pseudomonadota bacterium]